MLINVFLVILSRITYSICEKIVFGYKLDVGNSNDVFLIGSVLGVDVSDCVNICKGTDSCTFINYHRLVHVCGVIGQTAHMISSGDIVKHTGYMYGNKSEWTNDTGYTDQETGCGPPPGVYMATILGNMYTIGRLVQYICTNNDSLTERTVCQADGSWRVTNLLCITDCESAPVLNNAIQSGSSTSVGSLTTYICTQPYSKIETITCQQNGVWSPLNMQCIPDECYTSPHTGVYIFGSSCYKYIPKLNVWDEARSNCESLGGYLADISDAAEMAALWTFVQTIPYYNSPSDARRLYIGLTDKDVDGTFKWLDGNITTYTKWASNEPNGGTNENCVMFTTWNSLWYDMRCTRLLGSLCEFHLQ